MDPIEKEEEKAPYWQQLLGCSARRQEEGEAGSYPYLTQTHSWSGRIRDCRVLEVRTGCHVHFNNPEGKAYKSYGPGNAIVRKGRSATKAEIAIAQALTGRTIERVEIGIRFNDNRALFTALRAFGRNIEESILGVKESVLGEDIVLPGQIHRLLDEASRKDALDKALGILVTASELLRILNKTKLGFKTAWKSLADIHQGKTLSPSRRARDIEGVIAYLTRVGRIDPFFSWAHDGITELEKDEPSVAMAMARIKKAWQGEIVDSDEIDRVRKRISHARRR